MKRAIKKFDITAKTEKSKIPTGTKFTATIEGTKCVGKVFNDSKHKALYLCQNLKNGIGSPDKLGYDYSWVIGFSDSWLEMDIKNIKFYPASTKLKEPFIMPEIAGYVPIINKGHVMFGCQKVPNKLVLLLAKHLIK